MTERKRKPQSLDKWPHSMSQENVEQLIDVLCGCAGRNDCDCVSVFNRARAAAWYKHNSEAA
jgi:hypothetical protein